MLSHIFYFKLKWIYIIWRSQCFSDWVTCSSEWWRVERNCSERKRLKDLICFGKWLMIMWSICDLLQMGKTLLMQSAVYTHVQESVYYTHNKVAFCIERCYIWQIVELSYLRVSWSCFFFSHTFGCCEDQTASTEKSLPQRYNEYEYDLHRFHMAYLQHVFYV